MSPPQLLLHPVDAELRNRVHGALTEFLRIRRQEVSDIDESVAAAMDSLIHFIVDGGKRIRPTFAWWGWRAAGGNPDAAEATEVIRAISALELIQACALAHDDLMDGSDRRRGQPTLHVAFAMQHHAASWSGSPENFGSAAAILLGDMALAWADDMLFNTALAPGALNRVRPVWQAMRTEVLVGQYLDVLAQARAANEPATAVKVNRYKTAAYTVERPLHLGAALADGTAELISTLRIYGTEIGTGFQLRDDLLGVFGDPAITGKPAGDDLREGKRTLLIASAIQRAHKNNDRAAAAVLESALGNPHLDDVGVDRARAVLLDIGAVTEVEQQIAQHYERALAALQAVHIPEPAYGQLVELARITTRRDR